MKSEKNNPWFNPWFDILLHTKSIVCATVDTIDSQCLEYLEYITLLLVLHSLSNFFQPKLGCCLDTIVIVYNLQFGLDTKDLLHYDCYPKHSHAITKAWLATYFDLPHSQLRNFVRKKIYLSFDLSLLFMKKPKRRLNHYKCKYFFRGGEMKLAN